MPVTTTNQVRDLGDYNKYTSDTVLQAAVQKWSSLQADERLQQYGRRLGSSEVREWGDAANRYSPQLQRYDRLGNALNRVDFHSSWHQLMALGMRYGLHFMAWSPDEPGAQVERAAAFFLHGQVEAGTLCPLTMTSAALPVLAQEKWFATLQPHFYNRQYDARDVPITHKEAIVVGMGLTERQGGSDLSQTQTVATASFNSDGEGVFRLQGEKWFYSVPTADAHLVLARCEAGLSCFFVPRFCPDGSPNTLYIRRLKDKLGNRSNASAEVEFHQAYAVQVGEPGRGLASLMRMANLTRLDCVLGSTALMREAWVQAWHHAQHRKAFGRSLAAQPLMQRVLVEMGLETEAATWLGMRLAHALEQAGGPDSSPTLDKALVRLMIPAAKFWVCKRAQQLSGECMEVWGGNGYIEDNIMPRLYREAPVNSIWEGSANIMCLEVLKAWQREPQLGELLLQYLSEALHSSAYGSRSVAELRACLTLSAEDQAASARFIARQLVVLVQLALLRECAPDAVADAFEHWLSQSSGQGVYGLAGKSLATAALLERYAVGPI